MCLCTMCLPGGGGGQERASDALELELDSCEPPCVVGIDLIL